ncbi:molybdopterin cofactor-binding domain-containing protein, partial [Streptomyces asoensis]|uniref:xanthine dehydrogenase family protein molybdopterin-binding subunit n=1 Tax=Streptomyces asoensis TaxID=249586 RepID=UPI0033FF4DA2
MTTTDARLTRVRAVGTGHVRVEGLAKVTGAARYAGEVPFAQLAHGWLVLSTVARGRVRDLEEAAVLAMPGVLAVLDHRNAPPLKTDYVGLLGTVPDPTCAVFQNDHVPHLGWPVALVVAETSEQAREAAEALVVHYEQGPHDVDFTADRPDAHPVDGHMPAVTEKGDLEAGLAASAVVVDATYTTPEEHHHPMEPHAATAHWESDRLEVVDSNQGATWVVGELANLFSLDPGSVRVRSEHVGGGFGSKGVRAHQVAAVMASRMLGRPVRVVLTRRQMFTLAGHRSPTVQRVRLGADADGRLRAELEGLRAEGQLQVSAAESESRRLKGRLAEV